MISRIRVADSALGMTSSPVTRPTPMIRARPSATAMSRNTKGSSPVFQKGTLLQ